MLTAADAKGVTAATAQFDVGPVDIVRRLVKHRIQI